MAKPGQSCMPRMARAVSRRSGWMPPGRSETGPAGIEGRRPGLFIACRHVVCGPRPLAEELGEAPLEPADGSLTGIVRGREVRLPGDDVVELHDDIGAEIPLDVDDALGGEAATGAIDVAAELDAILVDAAEALE